MVAALGLSACGGSEAPPSAETESPSLSRAQANARNLAEYARCMQDRGWDAVFEDDGVTVGYHVDQEDAFRADEAECHELSGIEDFGPYTVAESDAAYDASLEVAECLQEAGFPVDDPPSRESYIATILDGGIPWSPFDAVFNEGTEEFAKAEKACPLPEM
nr:hypothetical protein [Actinomycetales bacterium]